MKNKTLFLLLVMGLIGTYFLQEKRDEQSRLRDERSSTLLNFSSQHITKLKLPVASIFFSKNQVSFDGQTYATATEKIEELKKKLEKFKIKRVLEPKDMGPITTYFPEHLLIDFELETPSGIEIHSIGTPVPMGEGLYWRVKKGNEERFLIVNYEGEIVEAYTSEQEKEAIKLRLVKEMLTEDPWRFVNKNLWAQIPLSHSLPKLEKLTWKSFRNPEFSLLPQKHETIPGIFKGLTYDPHLIDSYLERLQEMQFGQIFVGVQCSKKVSSLVFTWPKESMELQLYQKAGLENGYFVCREKRAYQLLPQSKDLFFLHHQDLWPKNPPLHWQDFSANLSFNLIIDYQLKNKNRHFELSVTEEGLKARKLPSGILTLFSLLGLVESDHSPYRLSLQPVTERSESITLKFPLRTFVIEKHGEELVAYDQKSKIGYHYLMNQGSFDWENLSVTD